MDDTLKHEFATLGDQIRKGFAANDRQFKTLKTRMAKMELELAALKRVENRRGEEIIELKSKKS